MKHLLLGLLLMPALFAAEPILVTEGLTSRVRVLYLHNRYHQTYRQLDFLERTTNLRFISVRSVDPAQRGMGESERTADGLLWDNAAFLEALAIRTERCRQILARRQFEAIVLDGKKLPDDLALMVIAYVREGGHAVWLGTDVIAEGPLAELCPWRADESKRLLVEPIGAVDQLHPYLAGIPIRQALYDRRSGFGAFMPRPVSFAEGMTPLAVTARTNSPVIGTLAMGKGEVLAWAPGAMVPVQHTAEQRRGLDADFVWMKLWEQVGACWKQGAGAFPAQLDLQPPAEPVVSGQGAAFALAASANAAGTVSARLLDMSGNLVAQAEIALPATTLSIAVPAAAASGWYLATAELRQGQTTVHSACAFVEVRNPASVELTLDRPGAPVGERLTFSLAAAGVPAPATLHLAIRDVMGTPVYHAALPAAIGDSSQTHAWTMPDYGVEGWAFRTELSLMSPAGERLAHDTKWCWRYQPWTGREKLIVDDFYLNDGVCPNAMMPRFARYHHAIGYSGSHSWQEPYMSMFNLRGWHQWGATKMEGFTRDFKAQDFEGLDRQVESYLKRYGGTAAHVLQDFGEETGFYYHWSNNPFARTWKTDDAIPEGAHGYFRAYLRQRYGTIEALNAQWESAYGSFDEIRLTVEHGRHAPGWLFSPPQQDVPANIAPILDHHGFFFWYTREVAQRIAGGVRTQVPVSDWGMSFSLTFNLWSPVPMTMIQPAYHASLLPAWHARAIARSRGGNTPLFAFHWGFDEDERAWGQFWNHALAAGATHLTNWGGLANEDFTHSRASLLLARQMARVRPKEQFLLSLLPTGDTQVGIYSPDLDWQIAGPRPNFFLRPQGPEHKASKGQLGYKSVGTGWLGGPETQIYNIIKSSGYDPRYVTEDEFGDCKAIVLPWVEIVSESAAARLRTFVENGGMLITMPWLATHNGYGRPYETQPGGGLDQVLGLSVELPLIGQREVLLPPRDDPKLPLAFTQRLGSEPAYLWSFAHQAVKTVATETHVVLRHTDGQPAITIHPFGKGAAVHLNLVTFHHLAQYENSPSQDESLRQLFDNLLRHAGAVPAIFVEWPFMYGIGVHDWVQYQYRLPGSDIRVLALYADKLATPITANVVVTQPVAEVWDVLNSESLPHATRVATGLAEDMHPMAFTTVPIAGARPGQYFPVHLEPGQAAFFAIVPFRLGTGAVQAERQTVTAGEELQLTIKLPQASGEPIPGRVPIHLEVQRDGAPRPMLSRRLMAGDGDRLRIPTRIGDAGSLVILMREAISGRTSASIPIVVEPASDLETIPSPAADFPVHSNPGSIAIDEAEFRQLLDALGRLYLQPEQDKTTLSAYVQDTDISRHRLLQLLWQADWREHAAALAQPHLRLTGEDAGLDPTTGIALDPLAPSPARPVPPVWDPISFDDLGTSNADFRRHHARWLQRTGGTTPLPPNGQGR